MVTARKLLRGVLLTLACALTWEGSASASVVDITGLQDVSLLSLDPSFTATSSQNVCAFSNTPPSQYSVTASGSGTGSAFTLSAGGSIPVLPYAVQWNQLSGQTSGTALTPSVPLNTQTSVATKKACSSGPSSSASLIVVITTADLQTALSGVTYTGVLTLLLAPQ